jgi:hypothetical protein
MACGFVPEPMAREHIAAGRLVVKDVQRAAQNVSLSYAWRLPGGAGSGSGRKSTLGLGLRWWLEQLESPTTRRALLERHGSAWAASAL